MTSIATQRICYSLGAFGLLLLTCRCGPAADDATRRLATVAEMATAETDVWGDAARKQPDGASYEFFARLLPPLRYVNTDFRHYPLVLSAPFARVKARLVSNGSALNARANQPPMWREIGLPVHFDVGEQAEPFGNDLARLSGPRYLDGYLPIVQLKYQHAQTSYFQESFASVDPALAQFGAVLVRFEAGEHGGVVSARIGGAERLTHTTGALRDEPGRTWAAFDRAWQWDGANRRMTVKLAPGESAAALVYSEPGTMPPAGPIDEAFYRQQRAACQKVWLELLTSGIALAIPERLVEDAARATIVGNHMIAVGDRMHYSAGNAYDHLYIAECGDAVRALLLFGHVETARRMLGPLLDFQRQATRYHVAGHKLQLLNYYYWITRDAEFLRSKRPVWQGVVDFILSGREARTGLLPPDRYAGDIAQQVYSLNSNANCWRGLRDLAAILDELGEAEPARRLHAAANEYRAAILRAVEQSERRDVVPPFIPNALFGVEQPYDVLTATRLGSYYDLMAPYIIGSGVFGPGSPREEWMIRYLQEHGGVAMGMIRSTPHQGEFKGQPGVNVLYGLRYLLKLLERDDRERALVGFYGQLAQGMTRGTFIGAEGTRFVHGDAAGRSMYLPPNSASNAMFLLTLRYLLLQDWDSDDDGKPETLRLLYGVPRRWLAHGESLAVCQAPTTFGPVSIEVASRLDDGRLSVAIAPPPRQPRQLLLRPSLPSGYELTAATIDRATVKLLPDGSVDLTRFTRPLTIDFAVRRK